VRFVLPRGAAREWTFGDGRDADAVTQQKLDGRMDVDHGELLVEAAEAGAGVCQVLDFMARDAVREGRLVEVLASHRAPGPPVLAVHLPEKRALPRVRTFLDQLRTTFQVREAG
jgi:DNA-binding transcriptional LysR family regulator